MSTHTLTKRSAVVVYAWLIVLTAAEVGFLFMGISQTPSAILLAGTTAAKLLLIGLFFMHVKYDSRIAWLLPVVPLALALFFIAMLFPDLVFHLPLSFK